MARSRTPPSSLRRQTLSPEDMSYLSTGASVSNSTLPPQEVGIGEPGPSTRPGRIAGGLAAESMLSYEGARPTLSSMSQTHTRTSHALRDSSTPESRVQNAKRDLSKSVALSPPASTDGHLPDAQTRPQPQSQVTSTTTTPAHSLEPTKFVFGNPLTPAAFEARLKNSPRSESTRNTQGGSSRTRRTEDATASLSHSQPSRTSPQSTFTLSRPYLERSLSPEIPVYVPVPPSQPKRIHGRDEPTDEHGLPLVSGKTYFIGAPPPPPRPVTPQLDRSPISAYRSATSRGRGRGKGKRVSTGRPRGRPRKKPLEPLTVGLEPLSATTTVSRTGRPRGRPRKKPLEPLTMGLEPLSAATTVNRTGRPRGRPRKKPLELPTKGPDPLTSTTVGVPVGYVPAHGLVFQGSVQPYYSSTLSHWPNANTNMISQSTAVKGKGKMPAHYAQDDVFGASGSAPSLELRDLSSPTPVVSEIPDAAMEWYLDMATVTWRKRPRQTLPAGVGPSSQAPAPERTTILPAPHSTSSLPSKARTPPRARSPSDPPSPEVDAPSPTPSNLSLRSIPFVQVEPLKSRLRVRQGLQSHASIVSSEPSSSYRRSPSIVPDSEEEQEGESENQGSEGAEGLRAVEDSRLGSLTPSIPAHAHAAVDVAVPELPKGVNSPGPGSEQAHEEDVTQRQITGIGAAAAIEEPNASSTSGSQLPTGISEVDHVVQTVHVSEFQNRDGLFTSLKEAIITSSKASPPTAAQAQERPRLEFSGCYSVLIDPATVLNGEVVDGVASTLASEIGMMFRRVEKPTTAQTQQQDPTRGVITQYECMCGGLRGPVGLPSPPPTSESDVQNYDSASCGGKISIGVADIRAGFMRGMKVTVCARHP